MRSFLSRMLNQLTRSFSNLPMHPKSELEHVFTTACNVFSEIKDQFVYVTPLIQAMSRIRALHVPFSQEHYESAYTKANVTGGYMNIKQTPELSMGMFSIRAGSCIPLHDHPDMHGVLRVVSGKVQVKSYSILDRPPKPNQSLIDRLPKGYKPNHLVACLSHEPVVVSENDPQCTYLTPTIKNIHEIKAFADDQGLGAAFLDILSPPYSVNRDCNYYQVFDKQKEGAFQQEIVWLLKMDSPPEEFVTFQIPFEGIKF